MKLSKSKKAQTILYIVFIGFVLSLSIFYFYKHFSKIERGPYFVGEHSLEIIKSDMESQKDLVYFEQAAKLSANQAIYDLAYNGGYSEEFSNGKFNNIAIWKQGSYIDYKSSFKNYFNAYMNPYLLFFNEATKEQKTVIVGSLNYLSFERFKLINIKYNLFFDKTMLYGLTTDYLIKRIDKKKTDIETLSGFSLIKPSFAIDLNYNIDEEYAELLSQSDYIINSCKKQEKKKECVEYIISLKQTEYSYEGGRFKWALIESKDPFYAFEVKNEKNKIIATDSEGSTDFKPIVYRFALEIPSEIPEPTP